MGSVKRRSLYATRNPRTDATKSVGIFSKPKNISDRFITENSLAFLMRKGKGNRENSSKIPDGFFQGFVLVFKLYNFASDAAS